MKGREKQSSETWKMGDSPHSSVSLSGSLSQENDHSEGHFSPESDSETQKGDPGKYDARVHEASNPGLPDRVQMAAQKPSIPAWLI